VGLFRRRRETYNEQLMREAGLADQVAEPQPAPAPPPPAAFLPRPTLMETLGIPHGRSIGPDEWDACVSVTAPGFQGDSIVFVTLPGGDVLVEDEDGDRDVSPFADTVERELSPPYRATATRQTEDLWSVGAKRIGIERIADAEGDTLELFRHEGRLELRVDDEPSDAEIPELERIGERAGPDYYVEAERLDGDLWEVRVSAL
jgi:hypothetical protein